MAKVETVTVRCARCGHQADLVKGAGAEPKCPACAAPVELAPDPSAPLAPPARGPKDYDSGD